MDYFKEYQGISLLNNEAEALEALETAIGLPIPPIPEESLKIYFKNVDRLSFYDWSPVSIIPFGFHAEFGHVKYLYILGEVPKKRDEYFQPIILPVKCKNLRFLKEFSMILQEIPKFFNDFRYMQRINLSNINNPETINQLNFANMKDLTNLSLSNNNLDSIPQGIYSLKNLITLNISENKISEISEDIGNLQSLRILNANSNKIHEIPDRLGNLPNLKYIYLQNNKIENRSEKIAKIPSSIKLYIY